MTDIALITTTINVPHNLEAWRTVLNEDDVIIIAGDQKTPHEDVRTLLLTLPGADVYNVYLSPETQEDRWPEMSRLLGWDTVRRRNVALLEALTYDPKVIITVDDDNWPARWINKENSSWNDREELVLGLTTTEPYDVYCVQTNNTWYNVAAHLLPPAIHRGFPHSVRGDVRFEKRYARLTGLIGVSAMMWLGHPDVDALDRYKTSDRISTEWNESDVLLAPHTWCPFNSQATAFRADIAPLLFYWPSVGRYDDIWASFVAQHVMAFLGYVVRFGYPLVEQRRGEHTVRDHHALFRDLRGELFGYEHNEEVIAHIREWWPRSGEITVLDHATSMFTHLADLPWWTDEMSETFAQWIADVHRIYEMRKHT